MRVRILIAAVIATLWSAPGQARPTTAITLREATRHAITGNPSLAATTLTLVEVEAEQEVASGRYDAVLEVATSARSQRDQPRSTLFSQPLAHDSISVSAAITKLFAGGGEGRVVVSGQRDFATTRVPSSGRHADLDQRTITRRLEASVRQPLWGGRQVGEAIDDRLDASRDAVAIERAAVAARVLRDVENTYWQLYLAQREAEIRHDATVAAELQLRQVEAEIARGARPRLAAAEIEEEVARRREDELVARGSIGERSLDLARLLGAPLTTELRASETPDNDVRPTEDPSDPTEAVVDSVATLEVRASKRRAEAARAGLAQAEDEARWRIDAVAKGSLAAPRDRIRDALADTVGYGGWSIEVGITLRAPLGDRTARGTVDRARARWLTARIARDAAVSQITAEIERLRTRRALAKQRRAALVRARELAEQNLAAESGRWERGDTTSFELMRRQGAVSELRLRIERARIDELDAETGLAAITGELLARHGVTLR